MTIELPCPKCGKDVEHEQFCDDFPCPHCGIMLATNHDCYYDYVNNDSWCEDWLETA